MKPLINDAQVKAAVAIGAKRTTYPVANERGLRLRVSPSGVKAWSIHAKPKGGGEAITTSLGTYPEVTLAMAKAAANDVRGTLRSGVNPNEVLKAKRAEEAAASADETPYLFETHVDDESTGPVSKFIELYAKPGKRTWQETRRIFNVYVLPRWAGKHMLKIQRSDVVKLMDEVAKENGLTMADRMLADVRKMFKWYQARENNWLQPIVSDMGRSDPKKSKRKRKLDDAEIRAFWQATGESGVFGALMRFLLLTAARRDEARVMRRNCLRSLLSFERVWTVDLTKTDLANARALPPAQAAIIDSLPVWPGRDALIFTLDGKAAVSNLARCKSKLDAAMLAALQQNDPDATLPHWTIHDLRRTARSLMSRAGVLPNISERVLGHVMPGVEGVYDQHDYLAEKYDALVKLAATVDGIVNSRSAEVVQLRA